VLGHHESAAAAFERAESLAAAIGHGRRHQALAGRARVALAQRRFCAGDGHVEVLLARRASARPGTALMPASCSGPAIGSWPAQATRAPPKCWPVLSRVAGAGGDDQRCHAAREFVGNVPHHRAIAHAWQRFS